VYTSAMDGKVVDKPELDYTKICAYWTKTVDGEEEWCDEYCLLGSKYCPGHHKRMHPE
jgi:hypothetical protein